ncbi:hypothetical protein [Chryseobacterium polytrichastri]|uniref:DUF3278 domain-containing protein n=1 Tax=Chryseobacterium polytrichastri TaxID=1302687 RepID=A0A1M6ZRW6_9FLAO|nr:hypothetical protein [Chryseobacterium polytrichastri]SHL33149.1 hypothetical protein SAMN05444267_101620 [Chryseobacterium polytrichastri]
MNIDELKNAWNEDDHFEETPTITLEQKNKMNHPLKKMQQNMVRHFWSFVISFIGIFIGLAFYVESKVVMVYSLTLVISALLVTIFYVMKFMKLYRKIKFESFDTYNSLLELDYQLKVFKETYVSFYISYIPFILCELILLINFSEKAVMKTDAEIIRQFINTIAVTVIAGVIGIRLGFQMYYGRYIKQIENLLKELK